MTGESFTEFHRRTSDGNDETDAEILKLIREAKNDSEKAHLIVLFRINKNLVENTKLTVDVVSRLQIQEKELLSHRALVNKGAGFWRALSLSLGVVLVVGGYLVSNVFQDVKELLRSQSEQNLEIANLKHNAPISREASTRLAIVENNLRQYIGELVELQHAVADHERADNRRWSKK